MRARKDRPYLTPTEVADMLMVSPVTVRQWAQRGELKAETTPGGHRRFLRRYVAEFARERGLSLQPPDDGRTRILIVDDDRTFAQALVELLAEAPERVEVEVANDGFDAGRKIHTVQPHLVLLDLKMDGMDGFEVCSRIKNDPGTRAIRVVAMTGHLTPENEERILARGAERCLSKSRLPEVLFEVIGLGTAPPAEASSNRHATLDS